MGPRGDLADDGVVFVVKDLGRIGNQCLDALVWVVLVGVVMWIVVRIMGW